MAWKYSNLRRFPGRRAWYTRGTHRDADGTTRRKWVSTGFSEKKLAQERLATLNMESAMGPERTAMREASGKSFADVFAAWSATKTDKRVSQARLEMYRLLGRYWLVPFGSRPIGEITEEDLRKYRQRRAARLIVVPRPDGEVRKKRKKGSMRPLAAATVNSDFSCLRAVFQFAHRKGWLLKDPCLGIEPVLGEIGKTVRSLKPDEIARLLNACREPAKIVVKAKRNLGGQTGGKVSEEETEFAQTSTPPSYLAPLVLTALGSGFRRRTLAMLEWRHLDLKRGEWHIPGALMKARNDFSAPAPASVLDELRAWRASLIEKHGTQRVAPTKKIFGIDENAKISKSFATAARRAGLEVSLHDCRRHFLNSCRRAGISMEIAMKLGDWCDHRIVSKHYREFGDEELSQSIKLLDEKAPIVAAQVQA